MSVAWVVLTGVVLALLGVAGLVLIRHHTHDGAAYAHDPTVRHLEKLRAQRPHVERLADRLENEQASNHFRIRVEKALRGQW